jgi:hypothetical protein
MIIVQLILATLGAFPTVPFLAHPYHDVLKILLTPGTEYV